MRKSILRNEETCPRPHSYKCRAGSPVDACRVSVLCCYRLASPQGTATLRRRWQQGVRECSGDQHHTDQCLGLGCPWKWGVTLGEAVFCSQGHPQRAKVHLPSTWQEMSPSPLYSIQRDLGDITYMFFLITYSQ